MKGTLTVKPVSAILRYDTRVFLKMCPFCIFQMDGQAGTTRPCKNGGKHPVWQGQSVELRKEELGFSNFNLRVELIDEQPWSDEIIGEVVIALDSELDLTKKSARKITVQITRKSNPIGEITLTVEWEPVPLSVRTNPQPRTLGYQNLAVETKPPVQVRSENQLESKPVSMVVQKPVQKPKRRQFTAQQMDDLLGD